MSHPLAHLYDLALRTLDDQQRRADALRSRLGPVLAAAALGVTLLSGPLLRADRPVGAGGALAIAAALGGLVVTLGAAFRTLTACQLIRSDVDAELLLSTLARRAMLHDEQRFYLAMIAQLGSQAARNAARIDRVARTFTAMLWGILVMLCGLALTALVG